VGGDTPDVDTKLDTYRRRVFDGAVVKPTEPALLMSRVNGNGAKADQDSRAVAISDDGATVVFLTNASNLGSGGYRPYVRNVAANTTVALGPASVGVVFATAISDDGTLAVTTAPQPLVGGAPPSAVYVTPAFNGSVSELLSRRAGAAAAQPGLTGVGYEYYNGHPQGVSADGRYVVFAAGGPLLTGAAVFSTEHVFRRDMRTGELVRVSRTAGGDAASGDLPTISADGTRVAFRSVGKLVPEDGDTTPDAYVADLTNPAAPVITLASRGGAGDVKTDAYVQTMQISADGSRVLFITEASNLGAPGAAHVYVRTLATATTVVADRATGEAGAPADADADFASFSGDGTRVAFGTPATNLGDGDADIKQDVHLRDLTTGTTTLVSRADGDAGDKGDSLSIIPVIARDGRSVAFRSYSRNLDTTLGLLPLDTEPQGYVRTLDTKQTRLFSRVGLGGAVANESVGPLSLSADGSTVAYEVGGDDTPANVAPAAPLQTSAIVIRTLATGEQRVIAVGGASDPGERSAAQGASAPSLSADGKCLTFAGRGTGIVAGVSPDYYQLFFRVLEGDCQTVAPVTPGPGPGPAPGPGPGPAPGPAAPATPVISKLSVTNKRFRVGTKATAKIAAVRKKRAPVGTTFRYTLNVPAATGITIQLKTTGRKVGTTCKAPTKALRKRKTCTRYVKVLALTRGQRPAGAVKVAFSGRVGKLKLKPGTYRALLVAVGAAPSKKRSKIRQITFTVVR
jgi:Tol biopolymer transport system component